MRCRYGALRLSTENSCRKRPLHLFVQLGNIPALWLNSLLVLTGENVQADTQKRILFAFMGNGSEDVWIFDFEAVSNVSDIVDAEITDWPMNPEVFARGPACVVNVLPVLPFIAECQTEFWIRGLVVLLMNRDIGHQTVVLSVGVDSANDQSVVDLDGIGIDVNVFCLRALLSCYNLIVELLTAVTSGHLDLCAVVVDGEMGHIDCVCLSCTEAEEMGRWLKPLLSCLLCGWIDRKCCP